MLLIKMQIPQADGAQVMLKAKKIKQGKDKDNYITVSK